LHAADDTITRHENLLGMKMQPKKLRSFAISTSKNKKIFAAGFSLGWANFYAVFFHRSSLYFHARKNR